MKNLGVISNTFNIGNHFFEQSLLADLRATFGDVCNVMPVEGRSVFHELRMSGGAERYFDMGQYSDLDYLVFSGPVFQGASFRDNFSPIIEHARRNGTKLLFLSCGSIHYDATEREIMKTVLGESDLLGLSTRDSDTFEAYSADFQFAHNGICSAFFLSKHFPGYDMSALKPYIVLNFEEGREPDLKFDENGELNMDELTEFMKEMGSTIETASAIFQGKQAKIDKYNVVRTYHTAAPSPNKVLTRAQNIFVSPNPFSYLNLFKNAEFVLARRVHACVPALSYGTPAMLFNRTKRAKIFDRVNLSSIREKLTLLDPAFIDAEHAAFRAFLADIKAAEFSGA